MPLSDGGPCPSSHHYHAPCPMIPTILFPVLSSADHLVLYEGNFQQIQLSQPFNYFGRSYSQLYLSMDGFLSFDFNNNLFADGYYPYNQLPSANMIAGLWTDIDTYTRGDITFQQATSGPLLQQATTVIKQSFSLTSFSATWVFVGTWQNVEFEPDTEAVTFQVVLISDSDMSYVLLNYGNMPDDPEAWKAGYFTWDNTQQYAISVPSTTNLRTSTNVGKPGRWAFRVDDKNHKFIY
ncbi:sushi, nidogen and EGF-like domain-containing protein 1 [Hoplias malabaricus]|uniref:sushi, nidogen and EGF-like domain-containing protein 1 n=1 Tax=Hoplias malabaricus TaxID=27720 RepID=UPI003462D074